MMDLSDLHNHKRSMMLSMAQEEATKEDDEEGYPDTNRMMAALAAADAESVQVELVPDGRLMSNADSTLVTPKGEIPKNAKENSSRPGKALRIRTDSRPGSSKNVSIIH